MNKMQSIVFVPDDLKYALTSIQDFVSFTENECKPAYKLPHYKDKPHIINRVTEDGQDCIYIETDGSKFERHGIIITENIPVETDMIVEIKIKPDGDSEGLGEFWLINEDNGKWINFKLFGGYYGTKKETIIGFNGQSVYLPRKLWDWGNWYYLHIQLGENKTVMALLDENRYILARHCYEQPVSSLFDSFSIAVSQEMGMFNRRSNLMKIFITDIRAGRCLENAQDLMSMSTKNDLIIAEVAEWLIGLHVVENIKDRYNALIEIWEKYRTYDLKIDFYLRPLINDYITLYNLPAELLEQVENDDTFKHFKIINEFGNHKPEELIEALNRFSNYHILKSKFYKEYSDDVNQVVYNIYAKIYKNNIFQKLFGSGALLPYSIFKSALFDAESDRNIYSEKDWHADYYNAAFHKKTKIKMLGEILKTIDSLMRSLYGYPKLIEKPKIYKTYDAVVTAEINKFCTEHMKFNSYAKKENTKKKEKPVQKPVEIDVSKLDNIRTAAEGIQELLIMDELLYETEITQFKYKADKITEQKDILTEVQTSVIKAILQNDIAAMSTILRKNGLMASIVIDEINEKLFGRFEDNCIEFIGDMPVAVDDYIEDLKGIINL